MKKLLTVLLLLTSCATSGNYVEQITVQECQYLSQGSFMTGCLSGLTVHMKQEHITPDMVEFCRIILTFSVDPGDIKAVNNYQKLWMFNVSNNE